MNLRTAKIGDITFQDLETFCRAGAQESVHLDFKSDMPADIAKTIAAMANTVGGMIFIGVDEGINKTAQLPFSGIDSIGLTEKIYSQLGARITPEIDIELRTFQLPDNESKCVALIRIPESWNAPHAHNKNSIYIRTGDVGKPESMADVDRLSVMFARQKVRRDASAAELTRVEEICSKYFRVSTGGTNPHLIVAAAPTLFGDTYCHIERPWHFLSQNFGGEPLSFNGGAIAWRMASERTRCRNVTIATQRGVFCHASLIDCQQAQPQQSLAFNETLTIASIERFRSQLIASLQHLRKSRDDLFAVLPALTISIEVRSIHNISFQFSSMFPDVLAAYPEQDYTFRLENLHPSKLEDSDLPSIANRIIFDVGGINLSSRQSIYDEHS